ncbi:MAG TPA: VOC family protein [Burkholderiales bacterium]|nr:VOC family protein [Burkholderiales bacterium]
MFRRIDHIELLTSAPERMLAFYREVLGFRESSRTRVPQTPLGPLDIVYMELGGTTVEIMTYPTAAIPPASTERRLGYQLMALEVDDMDEALELLKRRGIAPSWGPVKRPDYARAEIRDPDGNGIELRQWIRPA